MLKPHIDTFTWYDTETTGIDHDYDQILQAAFVKTDSELNILKGSETELLARPRIDVVPHPMAYLTHMIDIDMLKEKSKTGEALSEFELAQKIVQQFMSNPNNVVAGYNTVSFDDEVVRRLFFRNMLDPYSHEWRENNGRFDAYKMVQLIYALRPEMLTWRKNDKGNDSLKLEHLVEDNGLGEHLAHDAVSDVYATIALVKAIKDENPRMFDYMLCLSRKKNVQELLLGKGKIEERNPIINVSTVYGKGKRYSSIVLPIITDFSNNNKVLCVDLTQDPTDLLNMTGEDINKHLFTKREELPDDAPRVPAMGIQTNKLPVVMEMKSNTLSQEQADRMDVDLDAVEANRLKIVNAMQNDKGFVKRLRAGFTSQMPEAADPFKSIYAGFITDKDKNVRAILTQKTDIVDNAPFKIQDAKIYEEALKVEDKARQFALMLRAKWTNFGSSILASKRNDSGMLELTADESVEYSEWMEYLSNSLTSGELGLSFEQFDKEVLTVRTEMTLTEEQEAVLDKVIAHVENMKEIFQKLENINQQNKQSLAEVKESLTSVQRFERVIGKVEEELSATL